jgi:preprotein translocase subunit YajC
MARHPGQSHEEVTVLGSISLIAQANDGGSAIGLVLPLVLMGAVFYFLLIRPQQRRARQQRELIQAVEVGDEVITIGGMYGIVRAVDETEVTLEVSDGIEVRFLKSAIARRLTDEDQYDEEPEEEDQEAGGQS